MIIKIWLKSSCISCILKWWWWWCVTSSTGGSGSSLNRMSSHGLNISFLICPRHVSNMSWDSIKIYHRRSQSQSCLSRCPFWQQNSNCQWWRVWQWRQHRWQQRQAKPTATSVDSIFASLFHLFWLQGLDQAVQLFHHLPFSYFRPLSSPPFFHKSIWNKLFWGRGLIWCLTECQLDTVKVDSETLIPMTFQALPLLLYLTLWL